MTLADLIAGMESYRTQRRTLSDLVSGSPSTGLRLNDLAIIGALRSGRPVGLEPEGDIATVKMGTFQTPDGFVNVPTYWGQDLPASQAMEIARRNNYPMKTYPTDRAAEAAAIANSRKTGGAFRWPGYGLRMLVNPVQWGGE